jgi:chromosome segregation ATPase
MSKTDAQYFREMANHFAFLYDDTDNARRVAEQAGLNLSLIELDGSPAVMWANIVSEARKNNSRLTGLFQVAISEYPTQVKSIELFANMPTVDSVANGLQELSKQVSGIDRKVSALGLQVNGLSQQVAGLSALVINQ